MTEYQVRNDKGHLTVFQSAKDAFEFAEIDINRVDKISWDGVMMRRNSLGVYIYESVERMAKEVCEQEEKKKARRKGRKMVDDGFGNPEYY